MPQKVGISPEVAEAIANFVLEHPKQTALIVATGIAAVALVCYAGSQN